MGKIKKFLLFLTMVVFVVDIILVILYVKSQEEGEPIINVPTYDEPPSLLTEIPTYNPDIWQPNTPDKGVIIDIKYYNQDNFPTFCEGVTSLMALKYMGYDITINDIIRKVPNYEIKYVNGQKMGEDPNLYFIGNPRSADAHGCYAPVIENMLKEIAGDDAVHNLTGMEIEDIITQYINKGIPVIFWATMGMSEPTTGTTWVIERTGQVYSWKGREHCLLLAGSGADSYYFYDPMDSRGIIAYDKELVEQRYEQMGKMAVALVKKAQ